MPRARFLRDSVFVSIVFFFCSWTLAAGQTLVVRSEIKHDVSGPLRDMAKNAAVPEEEPSQAEPVRTIPLQPGFKPPEAPDLALQRTVTPHTASSPTLINNFEGIGNGLSGFLVDVAPPDTNGAVGSTQFVQWVNLSFAVFDKTTGAILPNFPVAGNTLWSGFGGACETNNDGDIIVMYDQLNNRWIFGQFAVRSGSGFLTDTLQCVAVSTSSDATGTYNRYSFAFDNEFDDYPKMAVWPDAYYATFNMFNDTLTGFLGADACAFDGNAMRNGATATAVCFQQPPNVFGLLPSNLDGQAPPPAGSPNFMLGMDVNSLDLYKFHVDFTTPTNSTFSSATNIPVTPFSPFECDNNTTITCVPQPDTSQLVDTLGDRLMYRNAYRNFGTHESLVVSHSVIANSSSGIRWYEIQNPNGTPTVAQQSTYAPDSNFRWMPSIAMDVSGDIALGYSVSSSTIFPSIAVTGQAFSDPRNTLQPETSVISGTGSQINGLNRWGDYSAMQIDPSDDCTFWYTQEYMAATGSFNWNTRVANFKFAGCGAPDPTITSTHNPSKFTQGDTGDTYTLTVSNAGANPTSGAVTVKDTLPTGLSATAIASTDPLWVCTLATLTCTRSDALPSGNSYPAITLTVNVAANAPGTVTNTATVSGGGDQNPNNNTVNDQTTVIQTGPDPTISKSHSGSFVQGQTGTYTITVTNVGLSPTTGTVTVTDALPAGLTGNSAAGTGWTCPTALTCNRSDALASNASYPPITLTVNVASNAASSVTNSVSVAGGGDTNPLNNTATDVTSVIPPPPDLTITKSHSGNFNQGQNGAVYTLVVKNISANPTTGALVTVTDAIPTGLTFSGMFGTGWNCPSAGTCTRGDVLAGNASYPPITLSVNVANNAPASVTNMVTVAGGGEVNTTNDTATDVTTINPSPDLTVALANSPTPFVVGQPGTYTITVSNVGNGPTSGNVTVNDVTFNGLTVANVSGTGWACLTAPISCQRSDSLAAGSAYPAITLTVNVLSGPSVTDEVNVSGGGEFNTSNDSASSVTTVTSAILAITKSHTGTFTVGQTGTYTIAVSNTGTVATSGTVTLTDSLPLGLTVASVTGAGWNCSGISTGLLNCTRSDALASNSSYPSVGLTVSIGNTSATVTNTASVTGGGDSSVHLASDQTSINVPTLAITKSHVGNFIAGQTGNYTIAVSNTAATATAGTVTVTDSLPFNMQAIAAGGTGWGCSGLPTTFQLTCTRSDSLPGASSYPPLTVIVNVPPDVTSEINSATVTGGGDGTVHFTSDPTTIDAVTLSIAKTHNGFTVGQPGTYTISVGNTGNIPTQGTVTVTDPLPTGMTAISLNAPGWSCSALPTTSLTCTRSDTLAAAQNYPPIILTVSVNATTSTFVFNTATVSGGGDAGVHSAQDTASVSGGGSGGGPSLTVSITHSGTFVLGQSGTYTIQVGNNGTAPTTASVSMEDFLPSALTATAVIAPGWNCSSLPTQFLFCSRSDPLGAGANYPPITLTVDVEISGTIVNSVDAFGGGDQTFHNASDTVTVNGPTLTLSASHSPDPFTVGQTGTYTITVGNTGNTPTFGTVTVSDSMPSNFTVASVTGDGWSCSGTALVSCTRSDALLTNNVYPPITLTVNVNTGNSFENIFDASGGGDPLSHVAVDTVNIVAPVLAITKSHTGTFTVGQTGTYTIAVTNTGTVSTVGQVEVSDILPQGLTLSSATGTGWNCSGTTDVACTRSDSLAANSSYPTIGLTVNIVSSAPAVTNTAGVIGGGDPVFHTASDTATVNAPVLAIAKSHSADLVVGQPGTYTITVSNAGSTATQGTVTVTDFLPFSLSATAFSGSGWVCSNLPTTFLTCTRSDSLAAGSSYPPLLVTVVATAGGTGIVNTASVTGGGDGLTHSASDPTNVDTPTLALTMTHIGNFTMGQPGAYTITVSNPGTIPSFGNVIVLDNLPNGVTVVGINGAGWSCSSFSVNPFTCFRSDSLSAGSSYPPITLTVALAPTVPTGVINQVSLNGGGDPNTHTAIDIAAVTLPDLAIAISHTGNFFRGQHGATYTITATNVGAIPTAGGTLLVTDELPAGLTATAASGTGWSCSILPGPQTEMDCSGLAGTVAPGSSYPPITLTVNVAANAPASVINSVSMFGISDANFANNFASDTTIINPRAQGADYDGDGKADIAVWRPSNGTFFVIQSSNGAEVQQQWGEQGDIPVPGDYDGDGKTDFAVWRPSTGTWFVKLSSTGAEVERQWGFPGDIPVPGDYDGDGKTDFAIWRPSTGTWFVIRSSDGTEVQQPWGSPGDIPVPGDYDGDGKTDFAIWRPSTGVWWVIPSSTGQFFNTQWGMTGDLPVPRDYDGDGKTDIAIWRPSTGVWWIVPSSTGVFFTKNWGLTGDIPVAADFDGDGKADITAWRPSNGTWFVIESINGVEVQTQWGTSTDIPVQKPIGQ